MIFPTFEFSHGTPSKLDAVNDIYTDGRKMVIARASGMRPTGEFPARFACSQTVASLLFEKIAYRKVLFADLLVRLAPHIKNSNPESRRVAVDGRHFDARQIWDGLLAVRALADTMSWRVVAGHMLHLAGEGWQLAVMGMRKDDHESPAVVLP